MPEHQPKSNQKKEWYKHGWGLVVAILFFPYFLVWYAWAKSNWSQNVKIAVTAILAVVMLPIIISIATTDSTTYQPTNKTQPQASSIKSYVGQDAKMAYDDLISGKYSVKLVFDRKNNGGFSEEDFIKFVLDDFSNFENNSAKQVPGEEESPIWVVTNQEVGKDKNVKLYLEYDSVVDSSRKQLSIENSLESKLSIVSAMTGCQHYGERNYKNFKIHGITGKIAEYALDEDTWYLKYWVDADGHKNTNMECYVTGSTNSPQVSKFLVY